ncbi:hypothetical protein HHK36_009589 [Tetracentron sinense]|uniref:Uncharacterized protein n=1 Tax=Tetracentron sinense TaxID=13715 RepID=A0A835DII3_TETSI|nr:hypothetical protein HHK36_009589 [Tetracentron sinense]
MVFGLILLINTTQNQASVSPRKLPGVSTQRARVTHGDFFAVKAKEEAKSKTSKQDTKNNKANKGPSAIFSPRKLQGISTQQTRVKRGDLLSEKHRDEAKSETPKQDRVLKKLKSSGPSLAMASSEKSQDLSARRMRVMRNLGLVAPCGSPFHRNGLTLPSI